MSCGRFQYDLQAATMRDTESVSLSVSDAADMRYPIVTAKIEVSVVALTYNMSAPLLSLTRAAYFLGPSMVVQTGISTPYLKSFAAGPPSSPIEQS